MITEILLRFGRSGESESLCFQIKPVTVFVGPNNSGKSLVLRELQEYLAAPEGRRHSIIADLLFGPFDEGQARHELDRYTLRPRGAEVVPPDNRIVGKGSHRLQVNVTAFVEALVNPNHFKPRFCGWYMQYNTVKLDGKNRIQLINDTQAGDLQQDPANSIQVLFRNDDVRREVRDIIYDAFSEYLIVDPTHLGHLRLKLSKVESLVI